MSILRGLGNDLSLDRWLKEFIWPAEHALMTPENVYLGTMLSVIEMVRSGTGVFSDMYFFEDQVARVCEETGIRGILGEAVFDFPSPSQPTPDDSFKFTRKMVETYRNHPLIRVSMALHSPYTCSPEVIRKAVELSSELQISTNIHLAETRTEIETIAERYGMTPVQHLHATGGLTNRTVAHHMVHLTESDMELIAAAGTSVVTLPNSNMKLGSGACSVSRMKVKGINVALGTDGPASNNNQSMVKEMQQLARLERIANLDPTCISAPELIRTATINGARAYHLDSELGSLEVGKRADMQIINTCHPHWHPHYDPYSSLAYAMQSGDVETVIVEGKPIMKNRRMVTIDEQRIYRQIKKMAGRIP
jgi:5-methylthioadenosine/S-adenosylhomocysteine deaminase